MFAQSLARYCIGPYIAVQTSPLLDYFIACRRQRLPVDRDD
jgi:hypothetical protein